MSLTLINKHRPKTFEEVIGQAATVKSVRAVLKRKASRQFLFCGPVGTGKTTLARIVAATVGCDDRNITEVNGASVTGIEAMRELIDGMGFSALGASRVKFYIIDECHKLSAAAITSLLKSTEEPPPHCYWVFCTSEPGRLPKAILTRFSTYHLSPVGVDDLHGLLTRVAAAEAYEVPDEVLYFIAQKSGGSPRQALSSLALCVRCKDRAEAAELLRTVEDDNEDAIILCRAIAAGGLTWAKAMAIVAKLGDIDAEGVRRIILAYFTKAAAGSTNEKKAGFALDVLEAFSQQYDTGSNTYCLLISLGRLLL